MRSPVKVCLLYAILAACHGELVYEKGSGGSNPGPRADGSPPVSTGLFFRPRIQEDLVDLGCLTNFCHGAAGTGMTVVPEPQSDDEWMSNYQQVKEEADSGLLWSKPTGVLGHPTDDLSDSHPMLQDWQEWSDDGAPYQGS